MAKSSSTSREDALFARVVDIIEATRGHVTRSVNVAMVQAYWLLGREIVEASSMVTSELATASGSSKVSPRALPHTSTRASAPRIYGICGSSS